MSPAHITLALLWIVYVVLHSLMAAIPVKRKLEKWLGKNYRYYRLFYTVFAGLGFAGIILYEISFSSHPVFHTNQVIQVTGVVITLAGALLMGICIVKYFVRLSGMYRLIHDNTEDVLMITGIHKIVRHPLYLGTFVFIWGLFIFWPLLSILIMNCIITAYTLIAVRFEEKKLVAQFGQAYKTYQQKVPMIIPGR